MNIFDLGGGDRIHESINEARKRRITQKDARFNTLVGIMTIIGALAAIGSFIYLFFN